MRCLPMVLLTALATGLWPTSAAALTQVATTLGDPRFEPTEGALYIPFEGQRPGLVAVEAKGQTVTIDVPGAAFPAAEAYQAVERSSLVRALLAAYDPEIGGMHLVLEGLHPLAVEPDPQYAGSGLRFAIAPAKLAPDPPVRLRSLPVARVALAAGGVSEQYRPELITVGASGVLTARVDWAPAWHGVALPLRLTRGVYGFDDPDYVGVTHQRTVTSLAGAAAIGYDRFGGHATSGLGYRLDLTQGANSALPTDPTFSFATYQFLHGPSLRQTFGHPLWQALSAALEVEWSPYVFAQVEGVAGMPWLTEFRIEPKLYLWPDERVSLGYFYERTLGSTFDRTSSGVMLAVTWMGW